MKDFETYLNKALQLCEDYTTTSPDSDTVELIYFTPQQLKQYTKHCMNNQSKTKDNASNQKK